MHILSVALPSYNGPSIFEVTEGDVLEVEIEFVAFPTPTSFVWLASNSPESPLIVGGNIVELGLNYISFSQVTRADAGTYNVTSYNIVGRGTFQFTLIVNCELLLMSFINKPIYAFSKIDPPRYMGESSYSVSEGTMNVLVELILDSNPNPARNNFSWSFNDRPLAERDEGISLGLKSILFENITRSHAGVYTVTSSNFVGSGGFSFLLVVYCEY